MAKKVLHVVQSSAPAAGSETIVLPGLFWRLAEAGVESIVLTGDTKPTPCDHARVVCSRDADERASLLADADVIHLHGLGDLQKAIAGKAGGTSTPVILSPMGALEPDQFDRMGWWKRRRARQSVRGVVDAADRLTALNDRELQHLHEWSSQSAPEILGYGIDFDDYADPPTKPISPDIATDQKVMLFLGLSIPWKVWCPCCMRSAASSTNWRVGIWCWLDPKPGTGECSWSPPSDARAALIV